MTQKFSSPVNIHGNIRSHKNLKDSTVECRNKMTYVMTYSHTMDHCKVTRENVLSLPTTTVNES